MSPRPLLVIFPYLRQHHDGVREIGGIRPAVKSDCVSHAGIPQEPRCRLPYCKHRKGNCTAHTRRRLALCGLHASTHIQAPTVRGRHLSQSTAPGRLSIILRLAIRPHRDIWRIACRYRRLWLPSRRIWVAGTILRSWQSAKIYTVQSGTHSYPATEQSSRDACQGGKCRTDSEPRTYQHHSPIEDLRPLGDAFLHTLAKGLPGVSSSPEPSWVGEVDRIIARICVCATDVRGRGIAGPQRG